jgi:hypothetical protein
MADEPSDNAAPVNIRIGGGDDYFAWREALNSLCNGGDAKLLAALMRRRINMPFWVQEALADLIDPDAMRPIKLELKWEQGKMRALETLDQKLRDGLQLEKMLTQLGGEKIDAVIDDACREMGKGRTYLYKAHAAYLDAWRSTGYEVIFHSREKLLSHLSDPKEPKNLEAFIFNALKAVRKNREKTADGTSPTPKPV